ncbi:uncharacterized protein B0H18DRAFT_1208566 [Fomitopsis serialis]|uniref:uncharacterized protein n=1 Tax=Fomitopsis serialis TaxID=139415 RepID=UPI00200750B2|nr:uncharacterized protein B0H18DRAFT_1208566 [Neoantrodia serialis]KAH9932258.1 hypothetical protein B0H18DRAFT_1208566 [Neoantrodia serialis]
MSGTFTCLDCGKSFRDASGLGSHSKSKKHGWIQVDVSSWISSIATAPASMTAAVPAAATDGIPASAATAASASGPATTSAPGGSEYKCMMCDLTFGSDSEISTHYKRSPLHPICGRCGKPFYDKSEFARHLRAAHAYDTCVCGVTIGLDDASAHYKKSLWHPKCVSCGYAFKDAVALVSHQKTSHYDQYCLRCDLWFQTKPDLHRHFFLCFAHPRCVECKEGFTGHAEYFQHMAMIHQPKVTANTPVKVVPLPNISVKKVVTVSQLPPQKPATCRCDHCDMGFTNVRMLRKHNRETPLHPCCILCDTAFKTYEKYENHMIKKHPEVELLPKLAPRSLPQAVQAGPSTDVQQSEPLVSCPGPQTTGPDVSASNCATATAVPEIVDGGDRPVESSVKPQVLSEAPIRDAEATASVVYDLPAADNAGPSGEPGQDAGTLTQTMFEQEHPVQTPEVNLGSDTGSVISFDYLSSTSSESDALFAQARALPHPSNTAVQCENADEREDEASSDLYDYIHADERSTDVNAGAIYERPDSVISYVTETDLNSAVLSASSSARPSDSTATQASSSTKAVRDMDAEQLDYPKDTMSESYVSAPLSDACTRGLSIRPGSIDISMESASCPATSPSLIASDTSADALPVSTGRTRGSTSSRSEVSEDVTSIIVSVATSTSSPTPAPSEPVASALPQGRSAASGPSWHCRSCGKDPCEDPTATQCGHIFCHSCIVKEIAEKLQCPVCHKLFLLRLHAE